MDIEKIKRVIVYRLSKSTVPLSLSDMFDSEINELHNKAIKYLTQEVEMVEPVKGGKYQLR